MEVKTQNVTHCQTVDRKQAAMGFPRDGLLYFSDLVASALPSMLDTRGAAQAWKRRS